MSFFFMSFFKWFPPSLLDIQIVGYVCSRQRSEVR